MIKPGPQRVEESSDSDVFRRLLPLAPPELDVPEESAARAEDFLRTQWRFDVRRRRRKLVVWRIAAIAATAIVAAGAAYLGRTFPWTSDVPSPPDAGPAIARVEAAVGALHRTGRDAAALISPGDTVAAGSELRTGPGDRAALRLLSGATLRLDVDTHLRLPSPDLVVLDQGAVYFDSGAGGGGGAIEIRTALGAVRDVGTQFEVRWERESLSLRVREGRVVMVETAQEAAAGEELRFHADGTLERLRVAADDPAWSWTLAVTPAFDLEELPVADFLEWVSRETGWTIDFADAAAADAAARIRLRGTTQGMTPAQAPAVILPSCGLSSKLEDGTLTIELR